MLLGYTFGPFSFLPCKQGVFYWFIEHMAVDTIRKKQSENTLREREPLIALSSAMGVGGGLISASAVPNRVGGGGGQI